MNFSSPIDRLLWNGNVYFSSFGCWIVLPLNSFSSSFRGRCLAGEKNSILCLFSSKAFTSFIMFNFFMSLLKREDFRIRSSLSWFLDDVEEALFMLKLVPEAYSFWSWIWICFLESLYCGLVSKLICCLLNTSCGSWTLLLLSACKLITGTFAFWLYSWGDMHLDVSCSWAAVCCYRSCEILNFELELV